MRAGARTTLAAATIAAAIAAWLSPLGAQDAVDASERVLLRMVSDSSPVGHYKFTAAERRQLLFDIPSDDPRAALLSSASQPKQTEIAVAATIVSTPVPEAAERRYTAYWLGFRRGGADGQGLTAAQWDSIFQKTGRRAVLRFTPRGQAVGVEVGSEAVRPVGQALGDILSGLALGLPADSVAPGDTWENRIALAVRMPDGTRRLARVHVKYRLRELREGADGLVAHIEFDGELVDDEEGFEEGALRGSYFGESLFSPRDGRYEQAMALANLELDWNDPAGLPPARLVVEWQAVMDRS